MGSYSSTTVRRDDEGYHYEFDPGTYEWLSLKLSAEAIMACIVIL